MTQAIEASRARLVAAADEARRRLERDLHDGAQERLVIAALMLERGDADRRHARSAARRRGAPPGPAGTRRAARAGARDPPRGAQRVRARSGARRARRPLAGPRQAARDAPARRADRGSGDLLHNRRGAHEHRKHAHATRASVTVDASDPVLVAEILDDGVGGAHTTGSGLRGFADRLEAVGGTLEVESPPGRGTRIRAHAPLLSPSLEEP
jgi:hypothetical protein